MINANTSKCRCHFLINSTQQPQYIWKKGDFGKEMGKMILQISSGVEFIKGKTDYIDPTGAAVFDALLLGITKESTTQSP